MECPVNLQHEITKRYMATSVKWCPRSSQWWIYSDGKKSFALFHDDYTPIQSKMHLNTSEVLLALAKADIRSYTGREKETLNSKEYDFKRREEISKANHQDDLDKEANDYTKVAQHGPRPFIHMTKNIANKD